MVDAEAVALGVAVGKKSSLQHAVGREADSGNNVCRVEGCLLDILEVFFRIAVEFQFAHFNERIVRMRPDLR